MDFFLEAFLFNIFPQSSLLGLNKPVQMLMGIEVPIMPAMEILEKSTGRSKEYNYYL